MNTFIGCAHIDIDTSKLAYRANLEEANGNRVSSCLPSRLSRVRIPRTGFLDDPLEGEAVRECLVCPPGCFPDGSHPLHSSRPRPTLPPPPGSPPACPV